MLKNLRKSALVAGATVGALALVAAPAMADPSNVWTVSPSPANYDATNSTNIVLSVNGIAMTCTYADASGTMQSATGNPGVVGSIDSTNFGTAAVPCTSLLGQVIAVQNAPWTVEAVDYDSATGVTTGYIGNVDATVQAGACTFRVEGEASGTYNNSSGTLSVNSNSTDDLVITESTNCGGIAPVGARPTFTGDYHVVVDGTTASPSIVGSN
ncbi:hypothetical protein [Streptomyces sp. KLOTTS4A1]|uniref:hypothetical protein n=1 Tax=Streptomyces sp. KLOTTS4A1 TaxID=3390996 RepID=UPI0039F4D61F